LHLTGTESYFRRGKTKQGFIGRGSIDRKFVEFHDARPKE